MKELDKLKEKLKLAEQKYEDLYNNVRVALYRTRIKDGKVLECNYMTVRLFGYDSKEEFLKERGYTSKDYADPNRRKEFVALLKERGEVNGFEIKTHRRDGSVLWVSIFARIYTQEGYIEGAIFDITPQKLLSPTERKVLRLVMDGKSNKEIADELKRSVRTIEDHRAHIMRKLGVDNAIELAKRVFGLC